jgi:translation initiation factor IF-2
MLSIKLHEATKQFKISNKLAMFFLEKKNLPVKSHSSVISMDQLEMLREFSNDKDTYPEIRAEFNRIEKEKKQKSKKAKEVKKEPEPTPAPKETPRPAPKETPRPETRPAPAVKQKPRPQPAPEKKARPETKPKPKPKPRPEVKRKPEPAPAPKREEAAPKPVREKELPAEPVKTAVEAEVKRPDKPAVPKPPQAERDRARVKKDKPKQKPQRPRKKDKRRDAGFKGDRGRPKQDRHGPRAPQPPPPPEPKKPKPRVLNLPEMIQTSNFINIKELADKLNLKLRDIEDKMGALNKEYVTNQLLEIDEIKEVCAAFKVEVDVVSFEDDIFYNHIEKYKGELATRAPVVTVMGHVDHGKTTLLDTLRNTRVADREAGGITQKIGAYKLSSNGNEIVFIDTPGHEAFTNIRARGAKVTDIVVLVVAANDGVKPQTIEAINHAQSAEVPIVVAINKIDLPGASPDKVKQELTKHNIVVEDWGGDVVSVEISAKNNQNLDALLEMLTLVSEMQELKSFKNIPGRGTIIESRLDPQLGPLGTVLLQHGIVKRGDFFICGNSSGKVKSIFDDRGKVLKEAQAPLPVEIMGFDEIPEAGELFQITDDIEKAYKVVEFRKLKGREARQDVAMADKKMSLQSLFDRLAEEKTQVFPIIMRSDNFSSGEVLEQILLKHNQEKLKINIVQKGVGNVTESDILLASTSGAIIIGFNVKTPQKLMALAKRENVEIKLYNVIYHLMEDMEKAIKGEIEPEYVENMIGTVEVLQTFKISKIGIIAGCLVKEGKVTIKSKVKVLRQNDLVFEGELETLRRVKNDVSEVNAGTECGIKIKNFNAIEIGDILEIYEIIVKEIP